MAIGSLLYWPDKPWSFDDVRCGFSQEETFLRKQSLYLSAFGETTERARIELSATILDEQGNTFYHTLFLTFLKRMTWQRKLKYSR